MKNNICNNCEAEVGSVGEYCSKCGTEVTSWWFDIEPEEFLEKIMQKQYLKEWYWNDDYSGFTDIWGNTYYCGYENGFKLEINDKIVQGISSSLKWYEQFAPKEAIEYHFNSFNFMKKLFAGLSVVIQITPHLPIKGEGEIN